MASQVGIISFRVLGITALDCLLLLRAEAEVQRFRNLQSCFFLHSEYILEVPIKILRPEMKTRGGVNQLRGDAHAVSRLTHAAFEHRAYAQFPPEFFYIFWRSC